jgi:arylsulfatase A-like enzyme
MWRDGALALAAVLTVTGWARAEEPLRRPNIVFVLTDDETVELGAYMPKRRALLDEAGATFTNAFVTYSFCCPARATTLRGQYAHNHRILGNEQPSGGFEKFRELGLEESTIAVWLKAAGYRTVMLGKYLNRYRPGTDGVPPGWDEWYVGGNAYVGYNYTLNENGTPATYGEDPEDFLTDVLTAHATDFIRRAAAEPEPFFVYVAPMAPHSPSTPAPRHAELFGDLELPRPASFDEADVSDKPAVVADLPPLSAEVVVAQTAHYRNRVRSMQAIDDMVEALVGALRATGQLDNTYLVYTSDNGYHLGEHRMPWGKTSAYEPDIRVPLVVRGPGVPAGVTIDAFVLNNDLAPTFADMARAEAPRFVDGRSFLPLFAEATTAWRHGFMVERRQSELREVGGQHAFDALRTAEWTYVEYRGGARELYDLRKDPDQLDNMVDDADPALLDALSLRLAELALCAASECRRLEDAAIGP